MNINGVSHAGSLVQLLQQQGSTQQTQNQAQASHGQQDGDGDHGVEPGKGQNINIRA